MLSNLINYLCRLTLALVICIIGSSSAFSKEKHYILGTNSIFTNGSFKIISDIEVSGLKIRHVRQVAGKTNCAKTSQHKDHIEMNGPINPDTPFIIKKLLKRIEDSPNRCFAKTGGRRLAISIYLNSGGGYMEDGYELGDLFREQQVSTIIAFNGECYSSCATAFIGGKFRRMGKESKIMFHAPYKYNSFYGSDISCAASDKRLKNYMIKMIGSENGNHLYKRTMDYCSKSNGWYLNKGAADIFGLLN